MLRQIMQVMPEKKVDNKRKTHQSKFILGLNCQNYTVDFSNDGQTGLHTVVLILHHEPIGLHNSKIFL